jgi:hypothetical protein
VEKVYPIAPDLPSLQAQISQAEYKVEVESQKGPSDIKTAVANLLALEHLPWEHQRDTGPHKYDLRPLINDIWIIDWNENIGVLGMRLECGNKGSGRPEQVAAALGFMERPNSIHRTNIILNVK